LSQAKYFGDGITRLDIVGQQYFIDGMAGL